MNIFTRIAAITLFLAITGMVNAQTYDLAVTAVATASNPSNQIPAGLTSPISMTIANAGSNAIPVGTEFWLAIQVNANYFIQPDTFVFTAAFGAGQSITLTSVAGYTFSPSIPSYEICAGAFFVDSTLESNPNNNFYCETYTASTAAKNDWASLSIAIQNPLGLDGFDLDNNTNTVPEIDSVTVILLNNSNITFPFNYGVDYRLALNGDTNDVTGYLSSSLDPGGQTTRIITSSTVIPAVPQDSGTYDFCVIVNEEADNVDSNNVYCTSFTIIDSYDPFHPSNWPTGEEELAQRKLKIVPMNDRVVIEGVEHPTQVTITDMNGRVIRDANISEDSRIDLVEESSGVYIIRAKDETSGQMETGKITRQ